MSMSRRSTPTRTVSTLACWTRDSRICCAALTSSRRQNPRAARISPMRRRSPRSCSCKATARSAGSILPRSTRTPPIFEENGRKCSGVQDWVLAVAPRPPVKEQIRPVEPEQEDLLRPPQSVCPLEPQRSLAEHCHQVIPPEDCFPAALSTVRVNQGSHYLHLALWPGFRLASGVLRRPWPANRW